MTVVASPGPYPTRAAVVFGAEDPGETAGTTGARGGDGGNERGANCGRGYGSHWPGPTGRRRSPPRPPLCVFSVCALASPLTPRFQEPNDLSNIQINGVMAAPVILGSPFRIPPGLPVVAVLRHKKGDPAGAKSVDDGASDDDGAGLARSPPAPGHLERRTRRC